MRAKKTLRNRSIHHKTIKNSRGISPVISTIIISGTLLIILVIASFVSANILELQIASTEFEQAKTNMMLLDEVIQDVALRRGAGGYVQFNQRSGGINIIQNTETLKILVPPSANAAVKTLNLRPNEAGTHQAWGTFGTPNHWNGTSDQGDSTGVQSPAGNTTVKETENLQDTTQTGTINNVTAYMRAKATSFTETLTAHAETITIGASTYRFLKNAAADGPATVLTIDSGITGRKLWAKFVYRLDGVDSIPAATWTLYYRIMRDASESGAKLPNASACVDIIIRKSDGTIRTSIAENVASANFTAASLTWETVSASYAMESYTVVYQTDYLEIDLYCNVTTDGNKSKCYLRIDDSALAPANQTKATNIDLMDESAKLIWKLGATEVETGGIAISRTEFTDYNNKINPAGGSWDWDDINNLEIGARVTTVGSNEYIQVSEFWIEVNYTPYLERTLSLVSLVYRGGSKVSGTDLNITTPENPLIVSMASPLSNLTVRTENGLKIKLDYNRVRIIEAGTLLVGNLTTNFIEITFIRLKQGTTEGSGTVNVKAQNTNLNTTPYQYGSGNITVTVQLGSNSTPPYSFSSNADQTVVMFTEITIQISISQG